MPNNPTQSPPTSNPSSADHAHNGVKCGKDCNQCLKGGIPMKREFLSFVVIILIGLTTVLTVLLVSEKRNNISSLPVEEAKEASVPAKMYEMPEVKKMQTMVDMPESDLSEQGSVGEMMANRRSRRSFSDEPVALEDLNSILLAAQGVTDEKGHRAAPSAKGAYPYTIYVVARDIEDLDAGLYEYLPEKNQLGDLGIANAGDLLTSAGVQDAAQKAPVVFVLAASPAKMVEKFPDSDPMKNVYLEGGHIGQNVYLMVEDLEMSMVVMGGFSPAKVAEALSLDTNEEVVYLMPLGNTETEVEAAAEKE